MKEKFAVYSFINLRGHSDVFLVKGFFSLCNVVQTMVQFLLVLSHASVLFVVDDSLVYHNKRNKFYLNTNDNNQ